jgi:hypothetical protein
VANSAHSVKRTSESVRDLKDKMSNFNDFVLYGTSANLRRRNDELKQDDAAWKLFVQKCCLSKAH